MLENGNDDIKEILEKLLRTFATDKPVLSGVISAESKATYIGRLTAELFSPNASLTEEVLFSCLKCLRLMCRESLGCEDLANEMALNALINYSNMETRDIEKVTMRTSIEACKCIINMQISLPQTRSNFATYPKLIDLVAVLQLPDLGLECSFLVLRLIFFASATNTQLGKSLIDAGILTAMANILKRCQVDRYKSQQQDWLTQEIMISECIKTGFNVSASISPIAVSIMKPSLEDTKGQEINQIYGEYLAQILQVLISVPLKDPPLSSPHSDIINTLMNIPVIDQTLYFPENSMKTLEVLLEIFSKSFQFIAGEKDIPDDVFQAPNDQALIPLCIVLKKLAANSEAKAIMKSVMVPPNIDRTRNLTIGPGLTAALVRAMTSAYLSQTRSFLGELLLSLFDDSVKRFVHYIGYANAAGYLFTKGITTPEAAGASQLRQSLDGIPDGVDPMTGRFNEEKIDPFEGMTDEEKNMEAEKLFVMIDRLNKTGVIKLQ